MLPGFDGDMLQSDLVSGLIVVVSPTSASKTQAFSDGASHTLTTNTVTATASGGVGPYTYATVRFSGDTSITATSSTGASTAFTGSVGPEDRPSAVFRITATDTATGGTAHADVPASLHYVDTR